MDNELAIQWSSTATGVRRNPARERVEAILVYYVARSFRVRVSALTAPGRTAAREALARHVAMYLAHVMFGWTYSRVAGIFCRHRTSVLYACTRVEDQRDDPHFDARICRLERGISSALAGLR